MDTNSEMPVQPILTMDATVPEAVTINENPVNDFEEFGLSKETFKSIEKLKYLNATPIQKACIPFLMENESDIIALAKTGTGKTAAFGIPMIEKLDIDGGLQGLVLCPTRELAQQTALNIKNFGDGKNIKVATILGGESYDKQLRALRSNPHIIVSTPGRLIDLIDQKIVKLAGVKYFVLDEADEMLSFGFQDALEQIWESLDAQKNPESETDDKKFHTWLFSATMSESIRKLAKKYLHNPHEVKLNTMKEKINIDAYAGVIFEEDKEDALALLIKNDPSFYGIIFATTKRQVGELELKLRNLGLDVDSLHGDKVQAERTRTINRMKAKQTKILVATDVAARGLDIQDLTHVVNFEIPWDVETFTHRIGRTARAGKAGVVWSMVKPKESPALRKFERSLGIEFKNLVIPTVEDVQINQKIVWLKEIAGKSYKESEFLKFEKALTKLEDEKLNELTAETKQWLVRAFAYFGQGEELKMKQPRSLELRKGTDNFSPGDRGGFSNDRGNDRGGYNNDRGGYRGRPSGGGYSNDRGGGDRGGYANDRGGSERGGYANDRGGYRGRPAGGGYSSDRGYNDRASSGSYSAHPSSGHAPVSSGRWSREGAGAGDPQSARPDFKPRATTENAGGPGNFGAGRKYGSATGGTRGGRSTEGSPESVSRGKSSPFRKKREDY